MKKPKELKISKTERLQIYKRAAKQYRANYRTNISALGLEANDMCYGICGTIAAATVRELNIAVAVTRQNFPEFYSYKPKHGWKKHSDYWWTLSIKRGGAVRRMDVLDRLAKGLSKGE